MKSSGKDTIFILLGLAALLLNAFFFNVTIGVLLITIVGFILIKPFVLAIASKTPVDTFINETVREIEAIPEVIERVEAKIHEEVPIVKQKISKLWNHHSAEIDNIADELKSI